MDVDVIRKATLTDVPTIVALARECYGPNYDYEHGESWLRNSMPNPTTLVLLGHAAFGIGQIVSAGPWQLQPAEGYIPLIAQSPSRRGSWEAFMIVRRLVSWATEVYHVSGVHLAADGTGVDLTPFAKRLQKMGYGVRVNPPSFVISKG